MLAVNSVCIFAKVVGERGRKRKEERKDWDREGGREGGTEGRRERRREIGKGREGTLLDNTISPSSPSLVPFFTFYASTNSCFYFIIYTASFIQFYLYLNKTIMINHVAIYIKTTLYKK